ncbi:Flp pilus assembly protein TadG [Shimia gijangensis]|uniref:Flp pilus assembly protein TadG n=1 Tax=Shimia gijangensis TaxID=1470563 RepID=A0A1M6IYV8_9RHOB|nr:pilus assembly protein TadG-related protein [Shimia gijangensis]SHJ39557.1 Flp pilus assembly protein TadG [Shimia gijangensis]
MPLFRKDLTGKMQQSLRAYRRGWLRNFASDESGAIVGFAVFLFLIIVMIGGIGIDIMRSEMKRTRLQHTIDRSILAAADLEQERAPRDVVQDYFNKSQMEEYLASVEIEDGINMRRVQASASRPVSTNFMKMFGIDTLSVSASGIAEESIGAVEISLILDISGSMGSYGRLGHLKTAANQFVSDVLSEADLGSVSISIIPYATQVNAGEELLDQYNISTEHNYSHCVDFVADQFSKSDIDLTDPLDRTGHFDPWSYSEGTISSPVCPVRASSAILPFQNNISTLQAYINGMSAGGNTSIDMGMKWGVALLDPSSRIAIGGLIDQGLVSGDFSNRPVEYSNTDVLKIAIVMSDGYNTDQYMLNPSLREGNSDVWYNAEEGKYSVYHSNGTPMYYWPHDDSWNDHPYGNGTHQACSTDSNGIENCATQTEDGTAVRLTYPELFNQVSLKWNAEYNYEFTSSAWADWVTSAFSKLETAAKNQFTNHICDAAKDEGIFVYSIGFEAPRQGKRVLERCASTPNHFFEADGAEIGDAFDAISVSIRQLKLTQ